MSDATVCGVVYIVFPTWNQDEIAERYFVIPKSEIRTLELERGRFIQQRASYDYWHPWLVRVWIYAWSAKDSFAIPASIVRENGQPMMDAAIEEKFARQIYADLRSSNDSDVTWTLKTAPTHTWVREYGRPKDDPEALP